MKRLTVSVPPSGLEKLNAANRMPRTRADTRRYIQILLRLAGEHPGERSVARDLHVSRALVRKVARLYAKGGVDGVLGHVPVAARPRLPAERIAALKDLARQHPDWRIADLAKASGISVGSAAGVLKGWRRVKPA